MLWFRRAPRAVRALGFGELTRAPSSDVPCMQVVKENDQGVRGKESMQREICDAKVKEWSLSSCVFAATHLHEQVAELAVVDLAVSVRVGGSEECIHVHLGAKRGERE